MNTPNTDTLISPKITTLERLKEWYTAGANGKEDMRGTKSKLKALLKLDSFPTLGETRPIQNDFGYSCTPPQPALIFKRGNFEARLNLGLVTSFLEKNKYTPRTPLEWLKENLVGNQGKFLLAGKRALYLSPINDTSAHVSDGKTIVRVALKTSVPEGFVDHILAWERATQVDRRIAVVNRKELLKRTQVFNKERSLELSISSGVIKVTSSDKRAIIKGSSELPALADVPCTLKVDPKVFNYILKHLKDEEVNLFINESCLSLNSEAFLAHWMNYPEFPKTHKDVQ